MARKLVIGNWKLNGSSAANAVLLTELAAEWRGAPGMQLVVCPPAPYLAQACDVLSGSAVTWGGQDVSDRPAGAFTGEVSAAMLKDLGCSHAIVGHSERRLRFGESNALVAAKAAAALDGGLVPVVCIGESAAERNEGRALAVLQAQVEAVLAVVAAPRLPGVAFAYEPLWAIGTGQNADPQIAATVHAFVRGLLARADLAAAAEVPILYGGSVKAANAAEYAAQRDIDGVLVGGASLIAPDFLAIAAA
ncbi:MAG: triose-phosphate isomerase, partial [Pseudomonadota bacterium]|nr:triose-phosphate isomerase [Pseudomonadota bacterium]